MNADILYEIYTLTRDSQASDMTIGLAMYRAQHPGEITQEDDRKIREFMGRYGEELSRTFPDRAAFGAAVEAGLAADAALEQVEGKEQES